VCVCVCVCVCGRTCARKILCICAERGLNFADVITST